MCFYVIYEWSHSHKLLLDAASVPTYNDKICHLDVLGPNHLLQIWNLGLKIRRWRRNNPMCTPTNPKREQPLTYHKKQKIKSNQTISLVQPIYSSTYISWINFCIIFMYINSFTFLYNYIGFDILLDLSTLKRKMAENWSWPWLKLRPSENFLADFCTSVDLKAWPYLCFF